MDQEINLEDLMSMFVPPPGFEVDISTDVNVKTLVDGTIESTPIDLNISAFYITEEKEKHTQLKIRLLTKFLIEITSRYFNKSIFLDMSTNEVQKMYDEKGQAIFKNTNIHVPGNPTPELICSLFASKINSLFGDMLQISNITFKQTENGVTTGYSVDEDTWTVLATDIESVPAPHWWSDESNMVGFEFGWISSGIKELTLLDPNELNEIDMVITYLENGNELPDEVVKSAMNGGEEYKEIIKDYFEKNNDNKISFN